MKYSILLGLILILSACSDKSSSSDLSSSINQDQMNAVKAAESSAGTILAWKSGLLLEARGQEVQQQPSSGSSAQQFQIETLSSGKKKIYSGTKCLSAGSSSQLVSIVTCSDSADQQFTINDLNGNPTEIRTVINKCFNILYGDSTAGRILIQYSCNGSGEQKFVMNGVTAPAPTPSPSPTVVPTPTPTPTVTPSPSPSPSTPVAGSGLIHVQKSGLVLEVRGEQVQQHSQNSSSAQQFQIQDASAGKSKIISGGKCLSAGSASAAVSVVTCSDSAEQQFTLKEVASDYVEIRTVINKCFNILYGDNTVGRAVIQYSCNGTGEQKFLIDGAGESEPVPTPTPTPTPVPTPSPSPVPSGKQVRIMPLGDSITYGWGSDPTGGYRGPLYSKLKAAGKDIVMVGTVNCRIPVASPQCQGHSGWTIQQIIDDTIGKGALEATNPDVIILMIGVNTLLKNPVNGVGLALNQLPILIDNIFARKPNVRIVLASALQANQGNAAVQVPQYNAGIPQIVAERVRQGYKISFVDMYPVVPLSDMPDRLHPSAAGYEKLAQAWFDVLDDLLP